jgi:nitrogen fixation protein NifQ
MTGYTEKIRQWAMDNRYTGALIDADGIGEVGLGSSEAGTRLAVRFTLKTQLNRVTDIRFQVFGCGFTIAACAATADMSVGYTLEDINRINARQIDEALDGLPVERSYCAELAVEALHAAVKSARNGRHPVQTSLPGETDHGARVTSEDPVYAALINNPQPGYASCEDRHLFACLLAIAAREPHDTAQALGLDDNDMSAILDRFFPSVDRDILDRHTTPGEDPPPEINKDVLGILFSHIPDEGDSRELFVATLLCKILAARVAHPGHLWVAMGLFERPQLTAAIRRHLPTLAEANSQKMRWKRYLFKQVCDLNGGVMCKAPNCGVCSDYALCFAVDE